MTHREEETGTKHLYILMQYENPIINTALKVVMLTLQEKALTEKYQLYCVVTFEALFCITVGMIHIICYSL